MSVLNARTSTDLRRGALVLGCVVVCAAALTACPRVPAKPGADKPRRVSHRPVVVARFPDLQSVNADANWRRIAGVIPAPDRDGRACGARGPVTLAEFPETSPSSRLFFLQYPACCETSCYRDPKTREITCGRVGKPIACRKDVLVEARDQRFAALAGSSFQRFDATAGRPTTRIFRFDLDADGTPEIVRWEELVQHQHVEWLVQAFRGVGKGVERVADIRFYHAGPWKPDLNFVKAKQDGAREIEISVQDVDRASQQVVIKRHIYRFDRLLGRYTQARTVVSTPPGMEPPKQAQ